MATFYPQFGPGSFLFWYLIAGVVFFLAFARWARKLRASEADQRPRHTILDDFPELGIRTVQEKYYRMVVQENTDLENYGVENIALAFALSQLRSDQRRGS